MSISTLFDTQYRTYYESCDHSIREHTVKDFIAQLYGELDDSPDNQELNDLLDYVESCYDSDPDWVETYSLPE